MMVPLQLGIVAFLVEMRAIGWLKTPLPFMVPACTTLGLLSFLWSWNSLFQPLIVISDAKLFTIPLGITLTSIPILFFFALFSKSLIRGLSSAAVKG